uniref:Uncharacterized protein n=1 Tax=Cyprinus carpio TaxID=7962 RepID=A0A8C2IXI0_CYPCA
LIILLCVISCFSAAETNATVCYILDGILIVYGIVLTVLYCRLKGIYPSVCLLQALTFISYFDEHIPFKCSNLIRI